MKVKYVLAAIALETTEEGNFRVLHFCGYEKSPQIEDYVSLYKELQTDPQFAITEPFVLFPISEEEVLDELNKEVEEYSKTNGNKT